MGSEARGRPGWFRFAASGVSPRSLSPPDPLSLCCVEFWARTCGFSFFSSRLSDVSDEVAKNFLSGGAGVRAGSETLTPLTLGQDSGVPREPAALTPWDPTLSKFPRDPLLPHRRDRAGLTSDSLLLVGVFVSHPPTLRASAAFSSGVGVGVVWFECLSVASSGTAAAPYPRQAGTEKRPKGPQTKAAGTAGAEITALCRLSASAATTTAAFG